MGKDDVLWLRSELKRADFLIEKGTHPDHFREALRIQNQMLLMLLDSDGIQDVSCKPTQIQGPDGTRPQFMLQRHDHKGKIVKTVVIGPTNLEVVT